jgi:hypothetical protein
MKLSEHPDKESQSIGGLGQRPAGLMLNHG